MALLPGTGQLLGMLAATGIYLVLFPAGIHFLREHRASLGPSARTHNSFLFSAAVLLFSLIITNWCLGVDVLRRSFMIAYPDATNLNTTYFVARSALTVMETIVLDLVLIYRVYTIWAKNFYAIILPSFLLVGSFVTGIIMLSRPYDIITTLDGYNLWLSFSLVTNLLAVGLIAYRIWSVSRSAGAEASNEINLSFVSIVIMESAVIYCACNAAALISEAVGSMTMWLFLDLMGVSTGIAFSLLLIRVREERRSRLIRRMSEAVDVPLPRRSHAVELPYKLGNL